MSAPQHESTSPATDARSADSTPTRPAGWVVGMSLFAATMMIVIGVFHAVAGVVALFRNEIYVVGPRSCSPSTSPLGAGSIFCSGSSSGCRVRGGVGPGLGARCRNRPRAAQHDREFLFIPYYPVWSLLIIALDVFVVWALCLFGRDAAGA